MKNSLSARFHVEILSNFFLIHYLATNFALLHVLIRQSGAFNKVSIIIYDNALFTVSTAAIKILLL